MQADRVKGGQREAWLLWFAIAGVWVAFFIVTFSIYSHVDPIYSDYNFYYRAAQRVIQGVDLYANLRKGDFVGPPLGFGFVVPVVRLLPDYRASAFGWLAVNMMILLAGMALMSRYAPSLRARFWWWLSAILFFPVVYAMLQGQLSILLFLLAAGTWVALVEKRPGLAGALVAIGIWLKFYPGLFLLYFLWKREWRGFIGGMVANVVLMIWQAVFATPQVFFDYLTKVLPPLIAAGEPTLIHTNMSLQGFVTRLFVEVPFAQPLIDRPEWASPLRLVLALLMMGVLIFATTRTPSLQQTALDRRDLEYALVLLTALLLGSTLYLAGTVSLLLVYFVILKSQPDTKRWSIAIGISAVLVTLHAFVLWGDWGERIPALWFSLPFLGMMLLWVLVVARLIAPHTENKVMAS